MTWVKLPLLNSAIPSPYLLVMNCCSFLSVGLLGLQWSSVTCSPQSFPYSCFVQSMWWQSLTMMGWGLRGHQHFNCLRIYTGHSYNSLSISWSDPSCFFSLLWHLWREAYICTPEPTSRAHGQSAASKPKEACSPFYPFFIVFIEL